MLLHRCKWSVVYGVFTKVHSLFGGAQTHTHHFFFFFYTHIEKSEGDNQIHGILLA